MARNWQCRLYQPCWLVVALCAGCDIQSTFHRCQRCATYRVRLICDILNTVDRCQQHVTYIQSMVNRCQWCVTNWMQLIGVSSVWHCNWQQPTKTHWPVLVLHLLFDFRHIGCYVTLEIFWQLFGGVLQVLLVILSHTTVAQLQIRCANSQKDTQKRCGFP